MVSRTHSEEMGVGAADVGFAGGYYSSPVRGQPPGSGRGADWVLRLIMALVFLYFVIRLYKCAGVLHG